MRALFRAYGVRFLCLGLWKVAHSVCIWFAAYYLIRSLIMYAGLTTTTPQAVAYGYALGILGAAVGQTFCLNQMQSGCASIGITVRHGCGAGNDDQSEKCGTNAQSDTRLKRRCRRWCTAR